MRQAFPQSCRTCRTKVRVQCRRYDKLHARFKTTPATFASREEGRRLLAQFFPERHKDAEVTEAQARRSDSIQARYEAARKRPSTTLKPDEKEEQGSPSAVTPESIPGKALIVVSAVSKNLAAHDFTRLSAKASALSGWNVQRGSVAKVIPGRDLDTLERQEHYFLIFDSVDSAWTYKDRVSKMSQLLRLHGPPSQVSSKPTPPHLLFPNEDTKSLLRRYALTTHEETLDMRVIHSPFPRGIQALMEQGGYPYLLQQLNTVSAAVVVRAEFAKLSGKSLRGLFVQAEKARNMPWTEPGYGTFTINPWTPPPPAQNPNLLREAASDMQSPGRSFNRKDMGADVPTDQDSRSSTPVSVPDSEDVSDDADHAKTVDSSKQFIIGFQTQQDAETFARYWHRRALPTLNSDEPPVELRAEVLW